MILLDRQTVIPSITIMKFSNDMRQMNSRALYFVILVLVGYILLDFFVHHSGDLQSATPVMFDQEDKNIDNNRVNSVGKQDAICDSALGHLSSAPQDSKADPWNQMKWMGRPARCKVKGQLIESLDEVNNFRRGFALRFVEDVENKMHLLPWLYGSKVDLNARNRRVFLDLGANNFHTSVQWFMKMYPCDFTEVHAFEAIPSFFRIPEHSTDEDQNWLPSFSDSALRVRSETGIPDWMLQRIEVYNKFVADYDDSSTNSINITRFMKEELNLTAADTVVVKMDIEGAEWPILMRWLNDSDMSEIIDELFVEIHYHHASMSAYHWDKFEHSREEATQLIAGLRSKGYFIHAWP